MRIRTNNFLHFFLAVFLVLFSASPRAFPSDRAKQTLTGTLVDVTCSTDPRKNLAKLRVEHTRKCLLMPICADSGYALLTENNTVLRFDAKGNELARKLIEKNSQNQSWLVSVQGTVEANQVTVSHLKLLKPN
jgi:hypothetical protein